MKRRFNFRSSALLVTVVLASGCGGGSGGDGIGINDLNDELRATICAGQVDCGFYPDTATCLESLGFDLDQLVAEVQAGIIGYDGDKAQECLDSQAAFECTIFGEDSVESPACDETFTGTIPLGGECVTDQSCAGLASCDGGDQEMCTTGMCVADEAEPADAQEGESCAEADCAQGLRCDDAERCVALAGPGEACAQFNHCVSGYICDLGPDLTPGTCVKLPTTGETCDPAFGGPSFGGRFSCLLITDYCDPSDTTCKGKLEPGEACGVGLENACVEYAECVEATCVAYPGLGDSCVVDSDLNCLGSLECQNGTCTAQPQPEVCPL